MRGFVVKDLAHPSKIPLSTDAPEPKLGPGLVLVDVYSAGLNFFDVRIIIMPHCQAKSIDNPSLSPRSCKLKANTKTNPHFPSSSAQNSQAASPLNTPLPRDAHSSLVSGCLELHRERLRTPYPPSGLSSSPCPTISLSTRVPGCSSLGLRATRRWWAGQS